MTLEQQEQYKDESRKASSNLYSNTNNIISNWTRVQDSGERQQFETGSQRDTQEGKGRYDLLPFHAIERLAIHFENGAKKYGDNNWRKGQPISRYYSSAMRHLIKWFLGWNDEDHGAAALWNIACAMETLYMIECQELPSSLDDRRFVPAKTISIQVPGTIDVSSGTFRNDK